MNMRERISIRMLLWATPDNTACSLEIKPPRTIAMNDDKESHYAT